MGRRAIIIIVSLVVILGLGFGLGFGLTGGGAGGGAAYGLEVEAPSGDDATSGDILSYVFTVKNTGDVADQFSLEGASEHGWDVSISPVLLEISPGAENNVTLELTVPRAVDEGTEDELSLIVTSLKSGEVVTASVTTTVTRNYMDKPHHIYGVTPLVTAATYASSAYPEYSANNKTVLVTSESYEDAMVGSVLACELDAPLLITSNSSADIGNVTAVLRNLGIETVYIVGELTAANFTDEYLGVNETIQIAAEPYNPYENSKELALYMLDEFGGDGVVFATGDYPSLFAAAEFGAFHHYPIVMVNKTLVHDYFATFNATVGNIYLVGLSGEIGALNVGGLPFDEIIKEPNAAELSYEIASIIARELKDYGIPVNAVIVTTDYAHGLGVIPFAYRSLWPALMTPEGEIPSVTASFLADNMVEKLWLAGDEDNFPEQIRGEYYLIQVGYWEQLRAEYPAGDWPLEVVGDVVTELDLTVPMLKQAPYASYIETVEINGEIYTGINVIDLLNEAVMTITPCKVVIVAADGYQKTFLSTDLAKNGAIILAFEMVDGQERLDLKVEGYPGWWWVKDVVKIVVIGE